ncbi:MAG: SO_0444 family Cu/Zn efflux transporter [Bacteroides sp.]|nr:SO_0444 family Cu/Zn efflux transporter [Bacteroides sp.]MCM1390765.1 SO_0444 family Cu/Zn efflux transporter [Bacteroides sp.]
MKEILIILFNMLNEMSPYILLGFLIAGVLHAFVSPRLMSKHLSGTGAGSVVKAALLGIPLPLCSCGVLPTAVALRRNGASRAASSSFLIATPQTGVDSIAATYSLLGPAFAIIRPVAALVTSFMGGMAVGVAERSDYPEEIASECQVEAMEKKTFLQKLWEMLRYGFFDMVRSIGKWLILGLVIASLITMFVPENFFVMLSSYPIVAMIAVVIVAVPMYVCATGSIPIALSLMLKGLSPGAAFVLLMAGPAANFASVTVIARTMGKRCATVYLGSIVLSAITFGLAIDYLLPSQWFLGHVSQMHGACHVEDLSVFSLICSIVLAILLIVAMIANYIPKHNKQTTTMNKEYKIKGMSCAHCKATVEKNLAKLPGVTSVSVDLSRGVAFVEGEHDEKSAIEMISSLGFDPVV